MTTQVKAVKTVGVSPKVYAPVAAQVIAFLVNLIASGEFDRVELAQLVGLALTVAFGVIAGSGEVEVQVQGMRSTERPA